jgi:serine/threonine-protein kinase
MPEGGAEREAVPKTPDASTKLGDYQLLAKLGTGGQADVYLALSQGPLSLRRLVVVKRLRSAFEFHEEYITMFLDEARLAARLAHPNVVHTYEVGRAGDSYFIAMEYLDGQPLEQVMRAPQAGKTFSHRMWAAVAIEALAGLHYAHELSDYDGAPLGIVHRDVSPHNIFLTYSGEVKLVDFGVAKAALNTVRTETGVLKGKVTYMAPEQARGKVTDRRSDLFAMGIILWEAITEKRLFVGDALQILHRLLNDDTPFPPPSAIRPSVNPALDAIVAKALARDPDDRFQSAEEMQRALEAYLRDTGEAIHKSDLAAALSVMFGEAHARVRERVSTYMTQAGLTSERKLLTLTSAEPDVPELSAIVHGPSSRPPPPDVPDLEVGASLEPEGPSSMRVPKRSAREHDAHAPAEPARAPAEPAHAPRRAITPIAIAIAIVAVGGVIAVRLATHAKPAPIAPAVAPLAEPRSAELRITSDPPGALVRWNGRALGQTPTRAALPIGAQTLIVSKEGYEDEPVVVEVTADAPSTAETMVKLRAKAPPTIAPLAPSGGARATAGKSRGVSAPASAGAPGAASALTSPANAASAAPSGATSSPPDVPKAKESW